MSMSPKSKAAARIERLVRMCEAQPYLFVRGTAVVSELVIIYRLLTGEMPQVPGVDRMCGPPDEQPGMEYEAPDQPGMPPALDQGPVINVEFTKEDE